MFGVVVGAVSIGKTLLDTYNGLQTKTGDDQLIFPTLKQAKEHLVALRNDLENTYQVVSNKMKASNVYESWVNSVNNWVPEVDKLLKEHEKQHGIRKVISCLNPFSDLSGRMKIKTGEALFFIKLVIDVTFTKHTPPCVEQMDAPNIEGYNQLQGALDSILRYLEEDGCRGVRIHGPLGVGKTAVMKNLNNHVVVATSFDLVIWVKVSNHHSEDLSNEDIQNGIATRLRIDVEEEKNLAKKIGDELKDKKFLLLLDGVNNDYLNIEEIGICPSYESMLKGSKIVLTCRDRGQCDDIVSKSVEIKRLGDNEARKLFETKLEGSITSPIMQNVIDYCSGLPYLIEKLAFAFKDKDDIEWWMGWERLQSFSKSGDKNIARVDSRVQHFYEKLQGSVRDCFLYSALYPAESDISEKCLFECWTAENLSRDNSVAYETLQKLKMGRYLEQGRRGPLGECVTMEKHIWRIARAKLRDDPRRHLVGVGKSSIKDADWNDKDRISLVNNDLSTLPDRPISPQLFTLFLQDNRKMVKIPSTFFHNMGALLVLNFQNTGVQSLPASSLRRLQNLKAFYISDCNDMEKLPAEIAELGSLEVVDIRGSGVKVAQSSTYPTIVSFIGKSIWRNPWAPLPNMGRLTKLKRLLMSFHAFGDANIVGDVQSFCTVISTIPKTLEELVIDVNSEQIYQNRLINMVRDTVVSMEKLIFLKFIFTDGTEEVIKVVGGNKKIYFPEVVEVTSFLNRAPESFEVYIGCSIQDRTPNINQHKRYSKICNAQGCNDHITKVLSSCNAFELVNDSDHEHLTIFGAECFNEIVGCIIEGCDKMVTIANGNFIDDQSAMLPELQMLHVKSLPLLTSLWDGAWKAGSMVNLQDLHIEDCRDLIELLNDSEISTNLKKLKKVVLVNLPNLTNITTNGAQVDWPCLEDIQIEECPALTSLPFNRNNAPQLKKIKGSQIWWGLLQDANFKQNFGCIFQPL